MNEVPPSDNLPEDIGPDDVDERYRRASALHPSRPSEKLRRAVLENAAELAAERAAKGTAATIEPTRIEPTRIEPTRIDSTRPTPHRERWRRRPAIFGTLAAAALAGLLITPRFLTHHSPITPAFAPPVVLQPKVPTEPGANAPAATAPPNGAAESPNAAAESMAKSSARSADASRLDASQARASPQRAPMPQASPPIDPAALRRAAENGDIDELQALLEERVSIDARDAGGRTALMLAILHGHANVVDALLAHGADPNAADSQGTTPLQTAVATNQPAVIAALSAALRARSR